MLPLSPASGTDSAELQGHVTTAIATAMRFASDGAGGYVLAATGRPAAALRSDGSGGYVLTPGATTSDAMIARVGSSILIR